MVSSSLPADVHVSGYFMDHYSAAVRLYLYC